MKQLVKKCGFYFAIILLATGCASPEPPENPKPKGYFRIEVPEAAYQTLDTTLPFRFDYSQYAVCKFERKPENTIWLYLSYPQFNADLNITYLKLHNDLHERIIAENELITNHYKMADDVEYSIIDAPEQHIFGQIYDIRGKSVACPLSFWMTDSVQHYFRGSLYFNHAPNNDSVQPLIDFIREDVLQLIETFEWK